MMEFGHLTLKYHSAKVEFFSLPAEFERAITEHGMTANHVSKIVKTSRKHAFCQHHCKRHDRSRNQQKKFHRMAQERLRFCRGPR